MQNDNASLTMIQRQVTDAKSGLIAYTYLAPEGWDIADEVIWDNNNTYNPAHLYAHCYNNNGLTIQVRAGYTNHYWANPMGNSGNFPPRDVTEVLKIYLPWLRGTNVQFTEATILSSSQQPGPLGFNSSVITQYGRVRGVYEKNGYRFDEIVYGSMTLTYIKQPPDFMGFFYEDVTWDITDLFLCGASGSRDPEAGVATAFSIKSSVRQTQQFYDYEQQTINLLRQQKHPPATTATTTTTTTSAATTATPGKTANDIMKETYAEINKMYEDTHKKKIIQWEKQNENFSNYIRDVDRYTDGKGTEYELPTGYQSAWVSSLGKVLLVDPNSVEREPLDTSYETWTRLSKKKY